MDDSRFGDEQERETDGSAEDRLIARYFKPIGAASWRLRARRRCRRAPAAAGLRSRAHGRRASSPACIFFPTIPPTRSPARRCASTCPISPPRAPGRSGFCSRSRCPKGSGDAWLAPFARGLGADAELFGCPLLGGDTVRTPGPVAISITAFGTLPHGTMVRRAGAAAGDRVLVTGTIGDAALGLLLRRDPRSRRALGPDASAARAPRRLAICCRSRATRSPRRCAAHASAAMDVSDGLAGDLAKLCRASRR